MTFQKSLRRIKKQICAMPSKQDLWYLASIAAGLSAILALGPDLQRYSVSLLTSQEASIYSSAYASNLVLYPSLPSWMAQTWTPMYFLMAVLIVAFATRRSDARGIFVLGSISAFVVLTITDIAWSLFHDQISLHFVAECALSNLIGAPIVSSLLLLLLLGGDTLYSFLENHDLIRRPFKMFSPLLSGVIIYIAAYYLITLFYHPTTTTVDAMLSAPASGYYSTADLKLSPVAPPLSPVQDKPEEPAPFGIFAQQTGIAKQLKLIGRSSPLNVNWSRSSEDTFDLSISAFDGCIDDTSLTRRTEKQQSIKFEDVRQISAKADEGLTDLTIGNGDTHAGYIQVPGDTAGMYWLTNGSEKDTLKVSTFLGEDARMTYWNPTGDLRLEISAFLMGGQSQGLVDRSIVLQVDGQERRFNFSPDGQAKWNESVGCRVIPRAKVGTAGPIAAGMIAGVVIEIQPRDRTVARSVSRRSDNQLLISGQGGWLSADNLDKSDVTKVITAGRLGLFSFQGKVDRFLVNGNEVKVAEDENIFINYAQLNATGENSGTMRITGRADAVYMDGARLNRTRWERLDWPARAIIFAGVPSALFWLFSLLMALLKRNSELNLKS